MLRRLWNQHLSRLNRFLEPIGPHRKKQYRRRLFVERLDVERLEDRITPSIGVNFRAIQSTESGFIPPDSMGDVSNTQILAAANGRIKVFDKAGNLGGLNVTTNTFFNSVRGGSGVSDPHVRFDRLSGRWFVTAINVASVNRVMIAVSTSSTITGVSSFNFFQFRHDQVGTTPNADTNNFADYDTLGVDKFALYIGVNMFSNTTGQFYGGTGFVVNKANLIAGTLTVTPFRQIGTASTGVYTPQGVNNDDPNATEGYFIGTDAGQFGRLVMRRVSNPGGTPTISGNINITVPATRFPQSQPASGSSPNLDALDDRLYAAAIHRDKITDTVSLWTAHNFEVDASGNASGSGNRNGSRWYQIGNLTGTPTLTQSGTLFDSAASNPLGFWIPSVAMNGQGHMALGTSVASSNTFAGVAVSGRLASDPLGFTQTFTLAQAGLSAYNGGGNPQRWGDYSQVVVDPANDQTMWTFQEYAEISGRWGVRAVQILAPVPARPASVNNAVVQGDSNVNIIVTGTSASGSGFFDPGADVGGPGYISHIGASVGGTGVTVNSVTFTDPTHITLNLTVAANAPAGLRTITVTNPDGQSITSASGILQVNGLDFGDAPDSYGTLLASSGARHVGIGLALGSSRDMEFDAPAAILDGNGDDQTGSDDENGVIVAGLVPGSTSRASVTVAGAAGKLDAWIDFNRNGVFEEPSERITAAGGTSLGIGTSVISFSVPPGLETGSTYARFRLSSAGGLTPTGRANDGEVEDYKVTIGVGKIVFAGLRDGDFEIYTMNADGSNQLQLTNNTTLDGVPAWSPDGTKIVFASIRTGNDEIFTMNADGTNQVNISNTPGASDVTPAWSPDGTKIAFMSNRGGVNYDIYVMNADGTNQVRLTTNAAIDAEPSWSPDGTRIVFSTTRDGNIEVYTMNADGSSQQNITNHAADDIRPDWSPDGARIVFHSSRSGGTDIYIMGADGSSPTVLAANGDADVEAGWSPDGAQIAFASRRAGGGTFDIFTVNVDGSGLTNIINTISNDEFSPAWAAVVIGAATTSVTLDGSNNLVVTDINAPTDDQLTIQSDTANSRYIISDPINTLTTNIAGATGNNTNTVTVPFAAVTGSQIVVNALDGNDRLTVDYALGNFSKGITYTGGNPTGGPGDSLKLLGGSFAAITHTFTNANAGTINVGGQIINYAGLEPIDMTGTTATNLVFNLPAGGSTAFLEDDGVGGNGGSRLRSNPVTFESTTFSNPIISLTINRGNASDDLIIAALPDFDRSLTIGAAALPFDSVNVVGEIGLAAGFSLAANATTITLSTGVADVTTAGSGAVSLTATRNIALAPGASITTVNGGLTLAANQGGTPTAGTFIGIALNGATVTSTTGNVMLQGKGGDTGSNNVGVQLIFEAKAQTTGSGTVTVQGAGGAASGNFNYGVNMLGTNVEVASGGGNVSVTGLGGGAGASGINIGVVVQSGSVVRAGGTGAVAITGTGGTGTGPLNHGVHVRSAGAATQVTSAGGNVSVTGLGGGSGSGGNNIGVIVDIGGVVSAGGTGAVTVLGAGGTATGSANYGVYVANGNAQITSGGGNVSVTGQGGGSGDLSSSNFGVFVEPGGVVTAGGTGSVTVTGAGGAGGGGNNIGVYVLNAGAQITSSGGDVSVTGQGGGTASSSFDIGVFLFVGGVVSAGGTGAVNVTGTGGAGAGGSNYGVFVFDAGSQVTSNGGAVSVTGTAGAGAASFAVQVEAGGRIASGADAAITVAGDSMNLLSTDSVNAGVGIVTLRQETIGTAIDVGGPDAPGVLGLTDAELDRITAGTLNIGDGNAGLLQITDAIDLTDAPTIDTLTLQTGAEIIDNFAGAVPDITVAKLGMTAITGIGVVDDPIETAIGNLEAGTETGGVFIDNTGDLNIGGVTDALDGVRNDFGSGDIAINNAGSLFILIAGDTFVGPAAIEITVTGANSDLVTGDGSIASIRSFSGPVTLTAERDLRFGDPSTATLGDIRIDDGNLVLTAGRDIILLNTFVDNAGPGDIIGNAGRNIALTNHPLGGPSRFQGNGGDIYLTAGTAGGVNSFTVETDSHFNFFDGNITVSADDMDINGFLDATFGIATLQQASTTLRNIDLGGNSAGSLGLTDAELDFVLAATVRIGRSDNAGDIVISSSINVANNTDPIPALELRSGGAVGDGTVAEQADITVDSLMIDANAGIGSGAAEGDVDVAVATITTNSVAGNGNQFLSEMDVVDISIMDAGAGVINLTGGTFVTGSIASDTVVDNGATLAGTGDVAGSVAAQPGGAVSPGTSPGLLTTGTAVFESGSTLVAEINGATPGTEHDQLIVNGEVTLNGATLDLSGGFSPSGLVTVVLIDNRGSNPVIGEFSGHPEGTIVFLGGFVAAISYAGGDGNDVILDTAPDTDVILSGGDVVVTDINAASDDNLTVSLVGDNVRFYDPDNFLTAGAGAIQIDEHTVEVPFADITGNIQVNTLAGNDRLTVDYVGGDPLPADGLVYDAGENPGDTDRLTVTGYFADQLTVNHTGPESGNVQVGSTAPVIQFDHTEPLALKGIADDVIINLPATADDAFFEDDGTEYNGVVQLRSNNATFEITTFADPTGSLTINAGGGADSVTIDFLVDFDVSLFVSGDGDADAIVALSSIELDAVTSTNELVFDAEAITLHGPVITDGSQLFQGAVTLANDVILVALGDNQPITLGSTVEGPAGLFIETNGITRFDGAVGSLTPLAYLITDAGGSTAINGGGVITETSQDYGDAVTLGSDATLVSNAAGNITFVEAIDGPGALVVNTQGRTVFGSVVGGITPLAGLTTDAGGVTRLRGHVTTGVTGDQTYSDVVFLDADVVLAGNDVTFGSTIDSGSYTVSTPAFDFQDIAASGTPLPLGDEEMSGPVPIGFVFDYFGLLYTDVYVSSNGFLTVLPGQVEGCCSGGPLPEIGNPDGVIAGWWEDLNDPQGNIRYQTLGNPGERVFIVEFDHVPHYSAGPEVTFQIKLFEGSNNIEVHYPDAASDGGLHSAGIENEIGDLGIQYFLGTGSLPLNSAVRYAPGNRLTVNTLNSGTTTFGGAVGGQYLLTGLTTNADGTTVINGGHVGTTGDQVFDDPVILGVDTELAAGGVIHLAAAVNGTSFAGEGLYVQTLGGAVDLAAIGNGVPLKYVIVNTTGPLTLAGDITTDDSGGDGRINLLGATGGTLLAADIALNSDGDFGGTGGFIDLRGAAVDSAIAGLFGLTISSGDNLVATAALGTSSALAFLSVFSSGNIDLMGDAVVAGPVFLQSLNQITVNGVDAGASTILIFANQDATGSEGFTQAGGSVQTTSDDPLAILIIVNSFGGSGDAQLLAVSAGPAGTVSIQVPGGAIVDNNGAALNISAGDLAISTGGDVGLEADPLETAVATLSANTVNGGIFIANAGALEVKATQGGGKAIVFASSPLTVSAAVLMGGDVILTAGESFDPGVCADDLTLGDGVQVQSSGGSITLNAGDDIVLSAASSIVAGLNVELNAGFSDSDSCGDLLDAGAFVFTSTDLDVCVIGNLNIGFYNAGGTVSLGSQSGAITGANGIADNVTAPALAMKAATGIGVGDPVDTRVSNIEALTNTGGIFISDTSFNLTVGDVTPAACVGPLSGIDVVASGNIVLQTASELNIVEQISAPGRVELTALFGSINDMNGAAIDVTAADFTATAGSYVGAPADPLDTAVSRFEAAAGLGGVYLRNSGGLIIGGVLASIVGVSAAASIDIATTGPLTVNENVVSAVIGNVFLQAGESAAAGDDFSTGAGVTIRATGGNVQILAGDNITLTTGNTSIQASGSVTIQGDVGDLDAAGSVITVNGTTILGTSLAISAGDDSDTFDLDNLALSLPTSINGGSGANDVATLDNVSISGAAGTGLSGQNLDAIAIATCTFNGNLGSGVELQSVGGVTFDGVTAAGNQSAGVNIVNAFFFHDHDSAYSANFDHGLDLTDIISNVQLTCVTADNNDADNDGTGDGLLLQDGADPLNIATVNLQIRGGSFRDADAAGAAFHQQFGIRIVGVLASLLDIQADADCGNAHVSGNQAGNLMLQDGNGQDVFINGADFDNSCGAGLQLSHIGNVFLLNASASGNCDHGILLTDVSGDLIMGGVTADNNDADNDGSGDGLHVRDGGDGDGVSVGGNVGIQNSVFRDTGAGAHQRSGMLFADPVAASANLDNASAVGNEAMGLFIEGGTLLTVNGGTYSQNTFAGLIAHFWSQGVQLSSLTTVANGTGVIVTNSAQFDDTGSNHSANTAGGILVEDIAGDVRLDFVTADNNVGDGFQGRDGPDAGGLAIGGDLNVSDSSFSATGGGIQSRGIVASGAIGGQFMNFLRNTVTGNAASGVIISDGGDIANVLLGDYSNNGGDGIDIHSVSAAVNMDRVVASDNGGDGIALTNVGAVLFILVTANSNDPGVNVNGAASFFDSASIYTGNNNHGMLLANITGDVTLNNTNADNNDADGVGGGDGVNASLGGNLSVSGGSFRNTGGPSEHQQHGIFIGAVGGSATFGGAPGLTVTGNEEGGVFINDGGTTASFSSGVYSNNGGAGIALASFAFGIMLDSVTSANNGGNGIDIVGAGSNSANVTGGAYTGNAINGLRLTAFASVNLSNLTASSNNAFGFNISNIGTLNLTDLTLKSNGSGMGSNIATASTVNLNATTAAVADTLSVTATQFQHTRGADVQQPVSYAGVGALNLFGLSGADVFNVRGTSTVTVTSVIGGADDDVFNISSDAPANLGNLDGIQGVLNVDGGAGVFNAMTVSDFSSAGNPVAIVSASQISGLAQAVINYTATGNFNVVFGAGVVIRGSNTGADGFAILSTLAGSTTRVEGLGGADTFTNALIFDHGDLDEIAGQLTLVGGAPAPVAAIDCNVNPLGTRDVLILNDRGDGGLRNYIVGPSSVTTSVQRPFAGVFYDGTMDYVRLDGTDVANVFDVSPSLTTQYFIDGNLPAPGVCTPGGGDFLRLNTGGTSGRKLQVDAPGAGDWTFTSGQRDVCFESIERFNHVDILAVANDKGAPVVKVYDAETMQLRFQVMAYPRYFKGGVRVATGDVNCDGLPDLITGSGPGRAATVNVFSGAPDSSGRYPGTLLSTFLAYEPQFKGGLFVAVGDVNNDGAGDVVTGADRGWLPQVRVFDGQTLTTTHTQVVAPFQAYRNGFRGGVRVAVGDINGDGFAEIVTGSGPGASGLVNVFDGATHNQVNSFLPFRANYKNGVFVAVGDANGDGIRDIIASVDKNWLPIVSVFNGATAYGGTPGLLSTFRAFKNTERTGVRLAVKAIDGGAPGSVEKVGIVLSSGSGGGNVSRRVRQATLHGLTPTLIDRVFERSKVKGKFVFDGIFVG